MITLKRGMVLKMDIPGKDIGHCKYPVVLNPDLSDSSIIGTCLINSKFSILPTKKNCQIPLSGDDYKFLSKKVSYVDCGEVIKMKEEDFNNSKITVLGYINATDMQKIVDAGKGSIILSKRDKSFFE